MSEGIRVSGRDLPGLYQAAGSESKRSQKLHLWILRLYLTLLVLGTIMAFLTGTSCTLALISAICFFSTLFLSVLLAIRRYDRSWYSARAVAESVKTCAWRYMMKAEPYDSSASKGRAQDAFLSDLQDILKQNREAAKEFSHELAAKDAITPSMEEVRSLDWRDRLKVYKTDRVEDQRNWYGNNATKNKDLAKCWFVVMLVLQGGAVACALLRIAHPEWKYLPTELFAVAAASALSWLQAKRFNDLSTSYGLAAYEIGIIHAQIDHVPGEDKVSAFVNDTEAAFSREHTQWVARRGA